MTIALFSSSAMAPRRLLRRLAGGAMLAALAVGLSACSLFEKKGEDMACPEIRIDRATASLTQFRPNTGQDITDIVLEGQIASLNGDCGWNAKTRTLDLKLKALFELSRGPAMEGLEGQITYFVAIPAFYPKPSAKQVFQVSFKFPEGNINTMMVRDEEVRITLPLGADQSSSDVPVYVGFQLTSEQLNFNRKGM